LAKTYFGENFDIFISRLQNLNGGRNSEFKVIDKNYWNDNGSFRAIFGSQQNLRNIFRKENITTEFTEDGITKIETDFSKAIQYLQSALGMTET